MRFANVIWKDERIQPRRVVPRPSARFHCDTCGKKHHSDVDVIECYLGHIRRSVFEAWLCGLCPDASHERAALMRSLENHPANTSMMDAASNEYTFHVYECTLCHEIWSLHIDRDVARDPVEKVQWQSWGKDQLRVNRT